MENKDWLNDYPVLKAVSDANPFIVPDGYFDGLEDRIISCKNLDELKNSRYTVNLTVPENYFEELAGNIRSRINIESAINGKDAGFTVPEGYFENLEEQIEKRIFIEEVLAEPVNPFTIPAGYFDALNNSILNKTVNVQNTKKKGIVVKLFTSTAFKYATAACFALAIGSGILINNLSNPANVHKRSFLHKELSTVPIDDIKNYLQLYMDAGDAQQTVASDGVTVDDNSLKNALQSNVDSVQ